VKIVVRTLVAESTAITGGYLCACSAKLSRATTAAVSNPDTVFTLNSRRLRSLLTRTPIS